MQTPTATVRLRRIADNGTVTTIATFTDADPGGWRKDSSGVIDHSVVAGSTYYFVIEASVQNWFLAGVHLHWEEP